MNLYLRLLQLKLRNRTKDRITLWDTAVTQFRVLPNDCDIFRHMTNSRYLAVMDLGRLDLLGRSGFWDQLQAKGWYPVVAGQTINYRRSLKPLQKYEVRSRVVGVDDRWIYAEQTFTSRDEVYARAFIRIRFLKKEGGSVSVEELDNLVGGFPDDLVVPEWIKDWTSGSRDDAKMGNS